MNGQETGTPSSERLIGVLPRDAKEAVELWDKGEQIAAFEVESEGAQQQQIYTLAFDMMRTARLRQTDQGSYVEFHQKKSGAAAGLTARELDAAHSIAYVAVLKGWAAMVEQHMAGGHIRAIVVRK